MTDKIRINREAKGEVESPPEFIPDPKITAKEEKFLKPTVFNKARLSLHKGWVALDENKRNIGAALIGAAKLLTENGAVQAASIVSPIGWGLLALGVGHAVFKSEKKKKDTVGESTIEKILRVILELLQSLKEGKKNG